MGEMHSIGAAGAPAASKPQDEQSRIRLQNAVRDFEAMFVGYMLKSMRNTVPKEEAFGDSFGGDILDGMFDLELARQMSRTSNFGIGEMLYRKMTGEQLPLASLPPGGREHAAPSVQKKTAASGESSKEPVEPNRSPASRFEAAVADRVSVYEPLILEAADTHGVDPNLLKAVMASESGGKADALSPRDAKGLMQLIDSTAQAMGVKNVWNARENIQGGARYLSQLMGRFKGNLEHVIASYNAGPGAVEKHGGIPPFRETQSYVTRVMQYLSRFAQEEDGQ